MDRTKKPIVVATVLVAFSCSLTLHPAAAVAETCWNYSHTERSFARRINRARANHGLARLRLDPQLSRVSRYHTSQMVKQRQLFHTAMTTLGRRVTNWVVLAENIGHAGSGRRIFKLMMKSASHRANILMPGLRFVGVGTRWRNGRLWLTTTLQGRKNPGTRLSMPDC